MAKASTSRSRSRPRPWGWGFGLVLSFKSLSSTASLAVAYRSRVSYAHKVTSLSSSSHWTFKSKIKFPMGSQSFTAIVENREIYIPTLHVLYAPYGITEPVGILQQCSIVWETTGWAKKLHTELMAITLSILNGFSKFFHCWKAK